MNGFPFFKKTVCAIFSRFKIVTFFSKVSCGNPVCLFSFVGVAQRGGISPPGRALTRLDITSLSLSLLSNHFRVATGGGGEARGGKNQPAKILPPALQFL